MLQSFVFVFVFVLRTSAVWENATDMVEMQEGMKEGMEEKKEGSTLIGLYRLGTLDNIHIHIHMRSVCQFSESKKEGYYGTTTTIKKHELYRRLRWLRPIHLISNSSQPIFRIANFQP